jgi:hypothetical protein
MAAACPIPESDPVMRGVRFVNLVTVPNIAVKWFR